MRQLKIMCEWKKINEFDLGQQNLKPFFIDHWPAYHLHLHPKIQGLCIWMRQHSGHSFYASLWRYVDGRTDGRTARRQRQRHRTHATRRCFPRASALTRLPCGCTSAMCCTHATHTCKTSLGTRVLLSPIRRTMLFFLAGTLKYLANWEFLWWVEFDTNQTLP